MNSTRSNFTQTEDEILRRCYSSNAYGSNAHRKAVDSLNKPGSAVLFRAVELGLTHSRERYRWTDAEIVVLEKHAHLSPEVLQKKLNGISPIKRTRSAIIRQIHRNKLRTNLDGLNHEQLCQALGLSRDTLHKYRRDGLIQSGGRMESLNEHVDRPSFPSPCGPWFYSNTQIRKFVGLHPGLINFRTVDGIWLVDLLLNGRYVEKQ